MSHGNLDLWSDPIRPVRETTLFVGPGTDTIRDALALIDQNWCTPGNPHKIALSSGTYNEIQLTGLANLTIQGGGEEETIIVTDGLREDVDPVSETAYNLMDQSAKHGILGYFDMIITGLTWRSNDVKYCIHADGNSSVGYSLNCPGCRFEHSNGTPVGIGAYGGQSQTFTRCRFKKTGANVESGEGSHGVYWHNANSEAAAASLTLTDCEAVNCGVLQLYELDSGQEDTVTVAGCETDDEGAGKGIYISASAVGNAYCISVSQNGGTMPVFAFDSTTRPNAQGSYTLRYFDVDTNEGLIDTGGLIPVSGWSDDDKIVSNDGYRTFVNLDYRYALRQNGNIEFIYLRWGVRGDATGTNRIRFKVLRPIGSGVFRLVDESNWISIEGDASSDYHTESYSGLSIYGEIGDFVGFCVQAADGDLYQPAVANITDNLGYAYVNLSASGDTGGWTTVAEKSINIRAYTRPPTFALGGDSIIAGYPDYFTHTAGDGYDILTYDVEDDPGYQMTRVMGLVEYQNHGLAGTRWINYLDLQLDDLLATLPLVVVVALGINDVNAGTTWATIEEHMDELAAAVAAASDPIHLAIAEILPWTAGTDAQAATIREWNAKYATWCNANGATILRCHDALAKPRASTGELDDMLDAYAGSGVHLSRDGKLAYAKAICNDLKNITLSS
jgi:lysophospholipase L1-like esterase